MTIETPEVTTPQVNEDAAQVPANYWGTDETHRFDLPDGIQWFEFKIMNEGDKSKFQKMTNTDLVVDRNNTARMKMDPVTERHTLIKTSLTSWNLFMPDNGTMVPVTFTSANVDNWLQMAPPKVVEDLEHAIRLANPWMQAEQTVAMIDEEIERLYELRKQAVEREQGESVSASK